jgi:preprotein translocase subunit SecE
VSQDNVPNKTVHLYYLVGSIVCFYILKWTSDWLWGYFTRTPNQLYITLFAAITTLVLAVVTYRSDRVYGFATEVSGELKKVSWPTGKEVKTATLVVIIMTIISAIIVGLYDFAWSSLTKIIYG